MGGKIKAAIIKAKATIIAASITTILGIVTTILVIPKEPKCDEIHYLEIMGINLNAEDVSIRIAGTVNETNFSFPSRGLAIQPENHIPRQSFSVKKDESGFNCDFDVIVMDDFCKIYDLKPVCPLNITGFIYSGIYTYDRVL